MVESGGVAAVTGASSGLGAEFARQLAAQGYGLVLIARRRELLEVLAAELCGKYQTRAEVLVADLTKPTELERVALYIGALPNLELLVNNAGVGGGGRYFEADTIKQMGMIALHVVAVARLARAVLPGMVQRSRGRIINVSSFVAFAHIPNSMLFCSTKKWMVDFSIMLAQNISDTKVRVQALCPGFTRTKAFEGKRLPRFVWMTPEAVVRESLYKLPFRSVLCVPGMLYKIIVAVLRSPFGSLFTMVYMQLKKSKAWREGLVPFEKN